MNNAIIFHGTGCTPDSFWHPYLKRELEQRGYEVWVPALPDTDTPELAKWLPVAQQGTYSKDTVVVAHSAGCPLALAVVEKLEHPIRLVLLVAGFARLRKEWHRKEGTLQSSYDWEKIKKNAGRFVFINSDNDPWGITDVEGRYMFDHLGGMQIILHGAGHMGSDAFKQPYKEFPLLVKLIE